MPAPSEDAISAPPATIDFGRQAAPARQEPAFAEPGTAKSPSKLPPYNGSAFAGLSANTPFYNLTLAIAMALGRFAIIVPVLALAGALAARTRAVRDPAAAQDAAMPTHGPMFVVLLVLTVLLVGALTYLPALALGPVVEHINLYR